MTKGDNGNMVRGADFEKTWIGHCFVTKVTKLQLMNAVNSWIAAREKCRHISSINVTKMVLMQHDERIASSLLGSAVNIADGFPVYAATFLLRDPIPERLTGVDLMLDLLGLANANNYRLFFFGAKSEVLELVLAKVRVEYPNLVIAGSRNGYFRKEEEKSIVHEIAKCAPDILLLALGMPQKEYFILEHLDQLNSPVILPVGGSFDVYAGLKKRAPKYVQRFGVEWLWRAFYDKSKGLHVLNSLFPFCRIVLKAMINGRRA